MAKPYEIRIKVTGEGAPQVQMIKRDLEAVKRSAAGVDKKMAAANKQTKALGRNMKTAGGAARGMGTNIKKAMGYLGMAAGGYLLVGQLKDASKAAMEFESSLANVNSLLGKSHPMYGQYREDILALKKEVPVLELQDMSAALYEGISAGHDAGQIMEYLDATAAGAAGGWTDMATVVKGTNKVMAAYGIETKDAIKITDIGLKTVEKANLNYGEYAEKIGMVVGSAATAQVSIEELHAAIAAASLIQRPEQVFTGLRGAMLDLPKKKDELKKLGIEYTTFGDTIRQIKEARLTPEDWQALGMEREGAETLKAIILQYDHYVDSLRELGDVGGTTMEKLADRTDTAEWKMAKFNARVGDVKIAIGEDLNEALGENLSLMDAFATALGESRPRLAEVTKGFSVWDFTILGMTSHWRIMHERGQAFGNWLQERHMGQVSRITKAYLDLKGAHDEALERASNINLPGYGTARAGFEAITGMDLGKSKLARKETSWARPAPEPMKGVGAVTGTQVHIDKVEIKPNKIDDKSFIKWVGKMVDEEVPA